VKEIATWYDFSGLMVAVEKTKAEAPKQTASSSPKPAPLSWMTLMEEEEENDPMENDFETEPVVDLDHPLPVVVAQIQQDAPQAPEPEKKHEPCCCCSSSFPPPPPGAKKGLKTKVCTQIPKHNKPPAGKPCTFPGLCSFAHSKEEADFYTAWWATH
jgi:hypothetical protein